MDKRKAAPKHNAAAKRGSLPPRGSSSRGSGVRAAAAGTAASSRRPSAGVSERSAARADSKPFIVKEPQELLAFLLQAIKHQGRNAIKSLLGRGQISVNGRVVTLYNHALKPGDSVSVSREKIVEKPPLMGLSILYEDEHIIVINKEAGLLSIASAQETDLTAYRQLTAYVRLENPENRIFVVHRLDRDTSGVMMFARSEEAQQLLQNSWQDAVKERTYVALVEGKVRKTEGTIKSWLKESKTLRMYSSPYPNDGQLAVTHYRIMQTSSEFSLLEVELETGRKNQIRVHMQDIGHPVVSDKKYGSKSKAMGRLGLHARVLSFDHPITGIRMRFETEIPKQFLNALRDVRQST
ncbi:RluA family pseudouridine synthase [Paenibacillus sepulcri]|uniref:RluA family pseudouridine synthase n=1 Tax=Paenibacillus sepulcri TaxID=359917 RepID=UPI001AEAEFF6